YYREVVKRKSIKVHSGEIVESVENHDHTWHVQTSKASYSADAVVFATGYYDTPNTMNIPGEQLEHVHHYFKEGHPYFQREVVVIGGKNSSVDAALELVKADANVTVLYRGNDYSSSVKPWILPEFQGLVNNGTITMYFNSSVKEIKSNTVIFANENGEQEIAADAVFAMTGYRPDHRMISALGIDVSEHTGRPVFNEESMESNVENIYICGVIAAGFNANEIFIENGRLHGERIAQHIKKKQ
ncbi:MAG: NAD(P)-binding domain-containing protein, partial [Bacilli bacterium]